MKSFSMRVDNPVQKFKFETTTTSSINELIAKGLLEEISGSTTDGDVVTASALVRVKSVIFRSANYFGERQVKVYGRTYFAMFTSNNLTASVDFKGTPLELWFPVTATKSVVDTDTVFAVESPMNGFLDSYITGAMTGDEVGSITATLVFEAVRGI